MRENLSKNLDRAINILILAIIFAVPAYFNILVSLTFQKVDFFEVLSLTAVLLFSLKTVLEGGAKIFQSRPFYLSLFLVLLSQMIATVFSEHRLESFFGWHIREMGAYTWLNVFLFCFLVFHQVRSRSLAPARIFMAAFFSSLLLSVYALMQVSGFDFIPWLEISDGYHIRASSTIGQPNFLGSFLLGVIPISFYLAVKERDSLKKSLFIIAMAVQIAALLATYSRGAWAGGLIAIFVYAAYHLWGRNRKIFFAAVAVSAMFAVSFFIWAQKGGNINQMQLGVLNRLKTAVRMNEGSVGMRSMYYRAALDLIMKRPIVGYGLDNQIFYFFKYYNRDYAIFERVNVYPDRAHNEILDILFTTGILGLSAWAFFFYAFIGRARRYFKKAGSQDDVFLAKVLIFALVAVLSSLLFSFYTESYLVYVWAYFGILFAVFSQDGDHYEMEIKLRGGIRALLSMSFVAIYTFVVWNFNARSMIADYYFQKARMSAFKNEYNEGVGYFSKAVDHAPDNFFYRNRLVVENLPLALSLEDENEKISFLEYLKDVSLEKGKENLNFEGKVYLAIVLSEIGRVKADNGVPVGDINEFSESEAIFIGVLSESKDQARIYLDLGNLYFYMMDYSRAVETYEKAISLYADLADPRMNDEHRGYVASEKVQVYKRLAEALINLKDFKRSAAYCEEGLKLYPRDADLLQKIGLSYYYSGNVQKAIETIKHTTMLYPQDDFSFFQLASVYKLAGYRDLAEEAIGKAISLKPDEKKYAEFLKE